MEEVEVEREKRENEEADEELDIPCCVVDDGEGFGEGEEAPSVNRLNFEKMLFVGVEEAAGVDAEELLLEGEL